MFSKTVAFAFFSLLAITLAHPIQKESTSEMLLPFAEHLSVPVHGNWCGPGHGGNSASNTPCIDSLDCKCKTHDLCYERYGFLNCKCDNDLIASLKGDTSALGTSIRKVFEATPCVGPVNFPIPKTCEKCVKVFGKKICAPYPCGFTNKCEMVPVVVAKSSVTTYSC